MSPLVFDPPLATVGAQIRAHSETHLPRHDGGRNTDWVMYCATFATGAFSFRTVLLEFGRSHTTCAVVAVAPPPSVQSRKASPTSAKSGFL